MKERDGWNVRGREKWIECEKERKRNWAWKRERVMVIGKFEGLGLSDRWRKC